MTAERSAVVRLLPEQLTQKYVSALSRELKPLIQTARVRLVFDLSRVEAIDSAGVGLLLYCMEEAMKGNGDLKLAAIPPEPAVILELTGVDRLFEIYESASDAIESFDHFPVHAFGGSSVIAGSIRNQRNVAAA